MPVQYVCYCIIAHQHVDHGALATSNRLKGEFNLDIMSQSGYWSYISVNNFHPLIVAFWHISQEIMRFFKNILLTYLDSLPWFDFNAIAYSMVWCVEVV